MPALSAAIGIIGLVSAIGGGVMSYMGQQRAINAEKDANRLQQQQMNLDAARSRRNIARQAIVMRGQALSAATTQGAGFGASSGVAGGLAGVDSQENSAQLGLNQNTQNANSLFAARNDMFSGESQAATGQAISSFGGMIMNNASMFGKIGSYWGAPGMGTSSSGSNTWGGSSNKSTGWGMTTRYV